MTAATLTLPRPPHLEPALADHHDDADRCCPGSHPLSARPLGQPVWCLACERAVTDALIAPASALGVHGIADLLVKAAGRRDGRLLTVAPVAARRGPGRTAPSASAGFDEIDEHARWAVAWAQAIATDIGRPPSVDDTGLDDARMPDLMHALGWLHAHVRPGLVGPRAAQFGDAVLLVHRRLQTLADEQPQRRKVRLPCPACDALGLYREDGRDLVQCVACGIQWTETDFQSALHHEAS